MAYQGQQFRLGSLTASSDYNDALDQFTLVTYTSTAGGAFKKQTSNGGPVIGILGDRPSSGGPGELITSGIAKVRVNNATHSAISAGAKLCASTSAGAIISTAVGKYVFGRAIDAIAANTTGFITCNITHEGAGSTSAATGA